LSAYKTISKKEKWKSLPLLVEKFLLFRSKPLFAETAGHYTSLSEKKEDAHFDYWPGGVS
jgi:hypothetical protein